MPYSLRDPPFLMAMKEAPQKMSQLASRLFLGLADLLWSCTSYIHHTQTLELSLKTVLGRKESLVDRTLDRSLRDMGLTPDSITDILFDFGHIAESTSCLSTPLLYGASVFLPNWSAERIKLH